MNVEVFRVETKGVKRKVIGQAEGEGEEDEEGRAEVKRKKVFYSESEGEKGYREETEEKSESIKEIESEEESEQFIFHTGSERSERSEGSGSEGRGEISESEAVTKHNKAIVNILVKLSAVYAAEGMKRTD